MTIKTHYIGMEQEPQIDEPVAFLAEFSGTPPEISEPTLSAIQDPHAPGSATNSSKPVLSGQPDETMIPINLLDHRVPQRGYEQEYGVPAHLSGAADVLHYHRKRVANADATAIDAAILRLYGPF